MNLANRVIIPLSMTIFCVSCASNNRRLYHDDFEDYYFTRWVKDDNSFTFYSEGKGSPGSGFGYFENNEIRFKVDIDNRLTHLSMIIYANDVRIEYDLEKVINNGDWDGTIRAYNDKTKEDFCFHPEPIKLEEIDLNHFNTTNLISEDKTMFFCFHQKSVYEQCNVWLYNKENEQYSLSFGGKKIF